MSLQYRTCTAKASFNSQRSISSIFKLCFSSSFGTAKTGPIPISSGAQPAAIIPTYRPKGSNPFFSAILASISTDADAPSDSWLALPAVMYPPSDIVSPFLNTGDNEDSPSMFVLGLFPSSFSSVTSLSLISPVSLSWTFMIVLRGTISSSNAPLCCPDAVLCWDWREYSSWYSRLILYREATVSAVSIIVIYISGWWSLNHGSYALYPFILSFWTRLMDSTPPPTVISMPSLIICFAAVAIAIIPLAHWRSIDIPGTVTGNPARMAACRAILPPLDPCCKAAPIITSPTSLVSIPALSTAFSIACPANSWADVSLKAPR